MSRTMNAERNKKLVKDTWDAFWRGDIEAGLENMSEDVTWLTPGTMKLSGLRKGKDAIRQFRFTELDLFLELNRTVVGLYGEGNTVILEVKAKGRLRNGEPYENAGCVVWELENDKIVRVRQYVDTQKALAINALFKDGEN
jgi:ketosteroid isomerase-like protein